MLVDRISCRLDSLALERENGIIDTLLCIHYHSHSFRQEREEAERGARKEACAENPPCIVIELIEKL